LTSTDMVASGEQYPVSAEIRIHTIKKFYVSLILGRVWALMS